MIKAVSVADEANVREALAKKDNLPSPKKMITFKVIKSNSFDLYQ